MPLVKILQILLIKILQNACNIADAASKDTAANACNTADANNKDVADNDCNNINVYGNV